jgi:hypothetical protein
LLHIQLLSPYAHAFLTGLEHLDYSVSFAWH